MNPPGKAALCGLAIMLLATGVRAAVTVTADRTRMTIDDAFTLLIRADGGEELDNADLSPLRRDFNMLGSSQSSHHSYVNGRSESYTELQITLEPRRTGALQVPSLVVDGARTEPVAIEVQAGRTGMDASQDVFVEADLDRSEVYVQGQLIYRFRIYQAKQLEERRRTPLEIPGATVEELPLQTWQRKVDGRNYLITEIRYAIFPEASGPLVIPTITFTAREPGRARSLFDRGRPVQKRARDLMVNVLPVPDDYPDAPWLPASGLAISEDWSIPLEQLKVGDSTTRTITLRARGLLGPQLPPLEDAPVDGIKLYPDRPRAEQSVDENGISALGINSAAWVATSDGSYEVPELRVPWWNVESKSLEYAVLPARRFSVAASPYSEPASVPGPAAAPATESAIATAKPGLPIATNPWLWTTAFFGAGWLVTLAWLVQRRVVAGGRGEYLSTKDDRQEAVTLRELLQSCEKGSPLEARESLRRWGEAYFRFGECPSLEQVDARIGDAAISSQLRELESALYGQDSRRWDGSALAAALREWHKTDRVHRSRRRSDPLPPLYEKQRAT
jgi:hypothetical protein